MTDKERIEKLLLTLKHLDNALMYLKNLSHEIPVKDSIDDLKSTIQTVLDANTDQITIDI